MQSECQAKGGSGVILQQDSCVVCWAGTWNGAEQGVACCHGVIGPCTAMRWPLTQRGLQGERLGWRPKQSVHGEGGSSAGSASMCHP